METKKTTEITPKTMIINAKISGSMRATFKDEDGEVMKNYDGPVPEFMPEQHWGDYINLEIDIETGRILNWEAPRQDVADFMNAPENTADFTDPDEELAP